jgi:hypothetical protein
LFTSWGHPHPGDYGLIGAALSLLGIVPRGARVLLRRQKASFLPAAVVVQLLGVRGRALLGGVRDDGVRNLLRHGLVVRELHRV